MATAFVACPHCGTQIHPIASRCKYCRADVTPAPVGAPVNAVPLAAHTSRARWVIGVGMIGAAALGIAVWYGTAHADVIDDVKVAKDVKVVEPPAPTVAPSKTPAPADKFAALAGSWRGTGDQPDWNIQWSVDLRLEKTGPVGSKVGTVTNGGTIECSGELIRMADEDNMLVLHERITKDVNATCVKEGTLKLTPGSDKLSTVWFYDDGRQAATGDLTR
jgi:hypothetical protein